jgi:3D (Asp-Asp-Asp) domain-containing protein
MKLKTSLIAGIVFLNVMLLSLCIYINSLENVSEKPSENIQIALPVQVQLRGTVYHTYSAPDGRRIQLASGNWISNDNDVYKLKYCAVSRDLLKVINYGDTLKVDSRHPLISGLWIVQDCMAKYKSRSIDFMVGHDDVKHFEKGVYSVTIKRF